MDTAVDIMNRRVNGLGVSEAEVQTQGSDNIIVNIPKGTNSEEARQQVGHHRQAVLPPGRGPGGHGSRRCHPLAERVRQRRFERLAQLVREPFGERLRHR